LEVTGDRRFEENETYHVRDSDRKAITPTDNSSIDGPHSRSRTDDAEKPPMIKIETIRRYSEYLKKLSLLLI